VGLKPGWGAVATGGRLDSAAGPYGTFKAALIHYTQGLAYQQLAAKGIRANTVSPGNTFFAGGVWDNVEQRNPALFAEVLGGTRQAGWPPRRRSPRQWSSWLALRCRSCPVRNVVVHGARTRGVQF
jgi:NAD(P)-dependent dehydrogenase (short-subunit alcohol dehydrogenase family)